VIAATEKAASAEVLTRAARLLSAAGRQVCTDADTSQIAKFKAAIWPDAAALAQKVDMLLVFGGDGTMLRVARRIAGSRTPILGVNIGGLGFLTAVPCEELGLALKRVWRGEFSFESRVLLHAAGEAQGRIISQNALNDIVISRGITSRLIELDVHVDGHALTRYRCDGLIIGTPTGSTAYSRAAGGAVIFPTAEALALTPICPHTLSNRSLILPLSARVQVRVISREPETILSADGRIVSEMTAGAVINVARSRHTIRLMHLEGSSFCETLRRKLHWRGTAF